MPVHYFVLEDGGKWYIRIRGKTYGGYPDRSTANEQALKAAKGTAGEVRLFVRGPGGGLTLQWSKPAISPYERAALMKRLAAKMPFAGASERVPVTTCASAGDGA